MWKTVRLTPSFILPIFRSRNENDYNMLDKELTETPQTGFERVKQMYRKNELDELSVELHTVVQSSLCGAFFGGCIGGFVRSRNAYMYFIENNQATIFTTTMQAKKKLQDYVTIAFAKGVYEWGWRLGAFTGIFSLLITTASVYRGDTTLLDYIIAGSITGALYKVNLGLAATIVGGTLGGVLSAVGGLAILGILKLSGLKMEDIRRAMYRIKEARDDQFRQALDKSSEIKNDPLTLHHDSLVVEQGAKKLEEI